jgi:death-on-curing protein
MNVVDDDRDRAPWSGLITIERLLELHQVALAKYGGREGPTGPEACVDAAVGAAWSAELYTTGKKHRTGGLPFGAYLMFYVARRHCFTDGNKRVAWMAGIDVLAQHNLAVRATVEEARDMIEAILSHAIDSGEQVTTWLAPRLYSM